MPPGLCPRRQGFSGPGELKFDSENPTAPPLPNASPTKMLTYALGRGLEPYDRPAVRQDLASARGGRTTASRASSWASSRARRFKWAGVTEERRNDHHAQARFTPLRFCGVWALR